MAMISFNFHKFYNYFIIGRSYIYSKLKLSLLIKADNTENKLLVLIVISGFICF